MGDVLGSVFHPAEISAMFKLKFGGYVKKQREEPLQDLAKVLNPVDFCYAVLTKVSRSFAVVIQQLPQELRDPVCIFYLALRGLDSVEDDMTVPLHVKRPLLLTFDQKLSEDGWNIRDIGDGPDYRILLANFEKVVVVFKSLKPAYQEVIADITRRMGAGMCEFAEKQRVKTIKEYNLYCHYVAGLVGHGLTRLFAASGLEDPKLDSPEDLRLSNSMGLFLQKTNIIRDYLEDIVQGRTWWPEEIWGQHAPSLDHFKDHPNAPESVACLNHMVTDALELVPDCLAYLARLRDPQVIRFCAIPQVMAIATLAECYNNDNVFKKVVKIRKGLSAKMMIETNGLDNVRESFNQFAVVMLNKVPKQDKSATRTTDLLKVTLQLTQGRIKKNVLKMYSIIIWAVLLMCVAYLSYRYRQKSLDSAFIGSLPMRPSFDWIVVIVLALCASFVFGFFGMNFL